jgi:hypothetical protein
MSERGFHYYLEIAKEFVALVIFFGLTIMSSEERHFVIAVFFCFLAAVSFYSFLRRLK